MSISSMYFDNLLISLLIPRPLDLKYNDNTPCKPELNDMFSPFHYTPPHPTTTTPNYDLRLNGILQ